MAADEWKNILEKVKDGQLSPEEAARLIESSAEPQPAAPAQPAQDAPRDQGTDTPLEGLGWWQNAWLIPVWVGTGILILGAWLLTWGFTNERFFWFYCSWLPFTLGILVLMLGVWSRQARWVHIRVQETKGTKISLSLPLPVRFASWVLKILIPRVPDLQDKNLEALPQVLDALGDNHDPLVVEVDDKDGDRVRVYIQ